MRSFHEEGMILTYLKSVFNSKVQKPAGYSQNIVNAALRGLCKQGCHGGLGLRLGRADLP